MYLFWIIRFHIKNTNRNFDDGKTALFGFIPQPLNICRINADSYSNPYNCYQSANGDLFTTLTCTGTKTNRILEVLSLSFYECHSILCSMWITYHESTSKLIWVKYAYARHHCHWPSEILFSCRSNYFYAVFNWYHFADDIASRWLIISGLTDCN